jgi:hypothetical protein
MSSYYCSSNSHQGPALGAGRVHIQPLNKCTLHCSGLEHKMKYMGNLASAPISSFMALHTCWPMPCLLVQVVKANGTNHAILVPFRGPWGRARGSGGVLGQLEHTAAPDTNRQGLHHYQAAATRGLSGRLRQARGCFPCASRLFKHLLHHCVFWAPCVQRG